MPKGHIDNNSALLQDMAWRRTGAKPLSEPMLAQFARISAAPGGDELKILFYQYL